jgi:cytochrome c556
MAAVLTMKGMDDADDEAYAGFANSMRAASMEIVEAVKMKNYDEARAAAGQIDKACSQCHESYR